MPPLTTPKSPELPLGHALCQNRQWFPAAINNSTVPTIDKGIFTKNLVNIDSPFLWIAFLPLGMMYLVLIIRGDV